MKVAVWTSQRTISLAERTVPIPGPGEMVIRVGAAAICGTDIRMWKSNPNGKERILGHELAGTIHALGKGVKGYSLNERVAVAPNVGCGICDQCVAGRTHLCQSYRALGINMDGGFAEYVLIPEDMVRQGNVCKLQESISFEEAASVEPLSCVYNAFENYQVHPGDAVLIIGAGPIGCMHAMIALMAGASPVMLSDLSPERLEHCKQLLPQLDIYCGDRLEEYVWKKTGGHGLDVCVTACPSPAAQKAALGMMALFGRVNFFGGLPADAEPVALDTNLIHYRHLRVSGTSRSSVAQYRKCLQLVSSGTLPLSRLITHRFSLEHIDEAFAFAAAAGGMKSVIVFPEGGNV